MGYYKQTNKVIIGVYIYNIPPFQQNMIHMP